MIDTMNNIPRHDIVTFTRTHDIWTKFPTLGALWTNAYGQDTTPDLHYSESAWHFMICEGAGESQRVVSNVGLLVRRCIAGGAPVRVGGVGGVATLTTHRGRGMAQSLMRAAHGKMRELGLEFGLLQCPDERITFYESLGWRQVVVPMLFDQPDGSRHVCEEKEHAQRIIQVAHRIHKRGVSSNANHMRKMSVNI